MILATLNRSLLPLVFLVILATSPAANAYYDPGVQRWVNRDPIKELGHFDLRYRHTVPFGLRENNLYTSVRNAPIDRIDALGLKDRGYPLDGVVCNDCFGPGGENFGTEVYVLINGVYSTLPPGKCTTSNPLSSDDVDGVWICRDGDCVFWNVQPSGPTNPFNACGKKPKNCEKWNGNPESGNSPRTRSGGKQPNTPPSPAPPIYHSWR